MKRGQFDRIRKRTDDLLRKQGSKIDSVRLYRQCVQLVADAIRSTKDAMQATGFASKDEEIWFFKEEAPRLWGLYLYYKRLVKIEAWRKSRSREKFRGLLMRELERSERFPEAHRICEYYYEGRTDGDEALFIRKRISEGAGDVLAALNADIPAMSVRLSQMRAYERLREWLMEALKQSEAQKAGSAKRRQLEWNIGPTDAVELFTGLYEMKCFGEKPFKHVMSWVREVMGIDVGNYSVLLRQICGRHNAAQFVNKVKGGIEQYVKEKA